MHWLVFILFRLECLAVGRNALGLGSLELRIDGRILGRLSLLVGFARCSLLWALLLRSGRFGRLKHLVEIPSTAGRVGNLARQLRRFLVVAGRWREGNTLGLLFLLRRLRLDHDGYILLALDPLHLGEATFVEHRIGLIIPSLQIGESSNLFAVPLDHQIPAILEIAADRGLIIDPHSDAVATTPNHMAQTLDEATNTRNLQAGADHNERIGTGADVGVHDRRNGLLVRVVLVVEDDARAHLPHAVAALAGFDAKLVIPGALRALGGIGTIEHGRVEIRQMATLLTDHLVETAVELNGARPGGLHIQRDLRSQGRHRGFDSIDILSVESREATFLAQTGQHVVKSRGGRLGRLLGERPDHILERGRQVLILVNGGIEEKFAGSLEVMLLLQGLK